jgi:DNA-directed RNA polymerase subunit delta
MNIKKMASEELEKLSHLDIAYNILKYDRKILSTVDLLKEVCSVLNYGDKEFENLIGDFYTSLNLDKRFIFIEDKWDLTENHSVKIVVDDDIDDDVEDYEDMDDEEDEKDDDEALEDEAVVDDVEALEDVEDDLDDEIEDLSIIEEDDLGDEEEEDI